MDNNTSDWNAFWVNTDGRYLQKAPKDEVWVDLVWRVGLEYWFDVFSRHSIGKSLLECGCGSAKLSEYMSARGYSCTMLDNSSRGIELAKSNFSNSKLQGRFHIGDVNSLEFDDDTFDIVYSGGLLHHFEDISKPVSEMIRVVKPGGLFAATVITDKFSCQTIGNVQQMFTYCVKDLVRLDIKGVWRRLTERFPFYVNSFSLADYVRQCEQSGLILVTGLCMTPFPCLALPCGLQKTYGRMMQRMMGFWKKFDLSAAPWTEKWGIVYNIYGVKK